MNAYELYKRVETHVDGFTQVEFKPCGLWVCGECNTVTLSNTEGRNTRESAEAHCKKPVCCDCNQPFETTVYSSTIERCTKCDAAFREAKYAREAQERMDRATEVDWQTYEGPLYDDMNGKGREGWFTSYDDMIDVLSNVAPEYRSEFVFCAHVTVRQFDWDSMIEREFEQINDDGYEDMQVEPSAELIEAIRKFNEDYASEMSVWNVDYTRKIRVPPLSTEGAPGINS